MAKIIVVYQTMNYDTSIKRNYLLRYEKSWKCQSENATYSVLPNIYVARKCKIMVKGLIINKG